MLRFYFYLNAVLYLSLALWCTLSHERTARGTGYIELNHSGHSEYLVIYGGLQLGLALFYAYLGYYLEAPPLARVGALFSILLYAPIVIYRLVTVVRFSPVSSITYGTGVLELILLIGAVVAWQRSGPTG